MKCPKCQNDNPAEAAFCRKCGTKLETKCPNCGTGYETGDTFCMKCGASLTEGAPTSQQTNFQEQFTAFRKSLPSSFREQMLTHPDGENRILTILFADMSDSVRSTANLHPEDAAEFLNKVLKAMVDILMKYEGRIHQLLGDGVLAYFGTPQTYENDSERAIRAALDIREELRKLGLDATSGINTGEVYLGEVGAEAHQEFAAMGPVVNLAARLQGKAEAGQIIVGEKTYRNTRRTFSFSTLSLEIKGYDQRVAAYVVEGILPHPEKIRGIEGLRAELIGREKELAELKDAFDEVRDGRGQMISIIGEAGVGKSRLAAELKAQIEKTKSSDKKPLWLEGRCLELGIAASYWPFIDMFREYFGWQAEDTERTRAEGVVKVLKQLVDQGALTEERYEEIGPLFGHILSIQFGNEWDTRFEAIDADQLKSRTFLAVRDFVLALAKIQPTVFVLEDLHWSDNLSLDLIPLLMESLTLAPILLVCVYRPDQDQKSWHLSTIAEQKCPERYTELRLSELTQAQSRLLIESLLKIENLSSKVKDRIIERAQGNPFFVEEVMRSLIDSDLIYQEDDAWVAREEIEIEAVPQNVQSLILSRVDRLQTELKRLLQSASVIGRLFQRKLLFYIGRKEKELEQRLLELEDHALIYKERAIPEEEYAFKHALTQETVYQNILKKNRGTFHRDVAEAIEMLYQDSLDEYYEQLAYHYEKAGSEEKAVEYLIKAGEKAARRYANNDALDFYRKASELAGEGRRYDYILELRGHLFLNLFRGEEAVRDYERLLERAKTDGNRRQELEALLGLGAAFYIVALDAQESDAAFKSRDFYATAYSLARELDDRRRMIRALIPTRWFKDFWPEYLDQVTANIEEASSLSQEIGDEELIIECKVCMLSFLKPLKAIEQAETLQSRLEERHDVVRLKDIYFTIWGKYNACGYFEKAVEVCSAAIKLAEEAGAPPVQFPTWRVFPLLNLGRYDAAWESLQEEVVDEAHKFGQAMKDLGTAVYLMELTAYDEAAELLRSVVEQGRSLGRAWLQVRAKTGLTRALLLIGKRGQKELKEICRDFEQKGASLPSILQSEIDLSNGRLEESLERAETLCAEAKEDGCRRDYIEALELRLRILLELGKPDEVVDDAEVAIRMAEEMRYLPMVWRLRAAKVRALDRLGDVERATQEYKAAAATIRQLADAIQDVELKRGFLTNPFVSYILEASK